MRADSLYRPSQMSKANLHSTKQNRNAIHSNQLWIHKLLQCRPCSVLLLLWLLFEWVHHISARAVDWNALGSPFGVSSSYWFGNASHFSQINFTRSDSQRWPLIIFCYNATNLLINRQHISRHSSSLLNDRNYTETDLPPWHPSSCLPRSCMSRKAVKQEIIM